MSELIIGVDVGFGNTKTSHKVFSSGVIKHSTKPPISSMVVETNEGFYSVGNPKITIQESKMNNEDKICSFLRKLLSQKNLRCRA